MQIVAQLVPIACKAQRLRAVLQPLQMKLDPQQARARIERHGLDQVKAAVHACEIPLGQTFGPFGRGHAVRHHAGAQAHMDRPWQ